MLAHKLGHYPTRFHLDGEIPPSYGSGTFANRLERMHARGDTCKHLYIPTSNHTHTHICLGHMQVFFSFRCSRGLPPPNPSYLCTPGSSTPLDVPLTGVARRSSLLFLFV